MIIAVFPPLMFCGLALEDFVFQFLLLLPDMVGLNCVPVQASSPHAAWHYIFSGLTGHAAWGEGGRREELGVT